MRTAFMEGGWAMYPIAALGCLGMLGGIVGFILGITIAKARTAMLAGALMGLGLVAPMVGSLGYTMGRMATERAIVNVSPDMQETIRTVGTAEAMTCIEFGVGAGLVPFCLGLALLGLGFSRLRPAETAPTAGV